MAQRLCYCSNFTLLLAGLILLITVTSVVTEVESVKVASWSKVRSRTTTMMSTQLGGNGNPPAARHYSPPPVHYSPPPVYYAPPPPVYRPPPPPPPPPPPAYFYRPPPPPPPPAYHHVYRAPPPPPPPPTYHHVYRAPPPPAHYHRVHQAPPAHYHHVAHVHHHAPRHHHVAHHHHGGHHHHHHRVQHHHVAHHHGHRHHGHHHHHHQRHGHHHHRPHHHHHHGRHPHRHHHHGHRKGHHHDHRPHRHGRHPHIQKRYHRHDHKIHLHKNKRVSWKKDKVQKKEEKDKKKKKREPSEFRGFVNGLYNQYLCRDGEPGGMAGWTGYLASGAMTESEVVNHFLNSAEYRGRGGRPCGGGGGGGRVAAPGPGRVAAAPGVVWQPRFGPGAPVGAGPGAPAGWGGGDFAGAPAAAAAGVAAVAPEAAAFVPAPLAPVAAPVMVKEWIPDPTPNAPWRAPPVTQINYPDILWDRSASTAQLACPQGQRIRVLDASYGAGQGVWAASGFIHKGICHAESSFSKVYRICSRQRTCNVAASAGIFGEPCSDTDKELLVTYQCTPAPKKGVVEAPLPDPISPTPVQILYDGIFMTQKRSDKTASLTCPAGQVINLLDATYGSHPGLYASNGYITRGTCHASSTLSVVSAACHGKAECRVPSSDANFPDSGCTEERKLKVTWRCDTKAVPFLPRLGPKPRRFRRVKKAAPRVIPKARAEEVINIAPPVADANQVHVHINVAAPKSKQSNTGLQAMVDRVASKNQAVAAKMDEILAKLKSQNCKGPDCLPETKELEDWKADWILETQDTAELVP